MNKVKAVEPKEIINILLNKNGFFPNNPIYPFLIYKQALVLENATPEDIQNFLQINSWDKSWDNGIYDYHHYYEIDIQLTHPDQGNPQFLIDMISI